MNLVGRRAFRVDPQSSRKAFIGSTRAARRAGPQPAASAATNNTAGAATSVV